MPRRGAAALLLTAAALVLLLSFRTPTDAASPASGAVAVAGAPAPTAAGGAGGVAEPVPAAPGTTPARLAPATPVPAAGDAAYCDGSYGGAAVRIRWGSVQVRVTIANGAIADVAALQLPTGDGHSADISWRVEPLLRSAALASQSASIDAVSGAPYTSLAYAQSLQAALDAARA